jgi:P-type Cu+ transporter
LTEGTSPKVTDFECLPSETYDRQTLLGIAKELESATTHPLAIAIQAYCNQNQASAMDATEVTETAGRGVNAMLRSLNAKAIIGNEAWMADHGAALGDKLSEAVEHWKIEGKSVVILAVSSIDTDAYVPMAGFAIADPIRPEAKKVVEWLKSRNVETWMITGDNPTTAKVVAASVGIEPSNVIAGALPTDKASKVEWLQHSGKRRVVAMVGDGINDSPVSFYIYELTRTFVDEPL